MHKVIQPLIELFNRYETIVNCAPNDLPTFEARQALLREGDQIKRQIERRTGFTVMRGENKTIYLQAANTIYDKEQIDKIKDEWAHLIGQPVPTPGARARQIQAEANRSIPVKSSMAVKPRTWCESVAAKKEVVRDWAQQHRVSCGLASVAGLGAGVLMTIDGFKRLRMGLGYDQRQDATALEGKRNLVQAVGGGVEMLAGGTMTIVGGWTGLHAIRGKSGPAHRA